MIGRCVPTAMLLIAVLALATVQAQDKKQDKAPPEEPKGTTKTSTVIGILTAKNDSSIEVKAPGEEKARRYTPRWVGGAPDKGGELDKSLLKVFSQLKVGSRIEVEWVFEQRPRALKVTVLREPDKK